MGRAIVAPVPTAARHLELAPAPSGDRALLDVQPLLRAFATLAEIPRAERAHVAELARGRAAAPREWLLRVGEPCRWVGFIVRGLVRHVRYDGEREANLGFDMEGRFVTELESFTIGGPAQHAIQALEPTQLLVLRRADLEELYRRHSCWERVGRRLGEAALLRKQRKERDLRLRSPKARYLRMVEQRPYLLGRVPLRHLASYLGMEPETLSRVRASVTVRASGTGRAKHDVA